MERKSKICSKCKTDKPVLEFQNNSSSPDGLQGWCKTCKNSTNASWRNNNREKARKAVNSWKLLNPEKAKANEYKWVKSNLDKVKASRAKWAKNNKAKRTAIEVKRRASKLNATPKWLTKDQFIEINKIYEQAELMTKESGILYEVDHIVPLLGKEVRGLHVPWNLRVIPASDNAKKGNKYGQS